METAASRPKMWRRNGDTPLNKQKEYLVYTHIKTRCFNEKNKSYHRYGGRGITVCDRWLGPNGYNNFLKDVGRKPSPAHSLDRINNNGNYEPSNCRWATMQEQQNNRNNNIILTIDGLSKRLGEWAVMKGVKTSLIYQRIFKYKWDPSAAINTPVQDTIKYLHRNGRTKGTKNKKPYYREGMKRKQENII